MAHIAGYLHATAAAPPASGSSSAALFCCEGRATSAQDASRRVAALAAGLTQQLGMQVGERVCVAALATDSHLEALLAVTSAGALVAPLNWRWSGGEAASAAVLVGSRLLLADAACLPFAMATAAAGGRGTFETLVLLGPPADYRQEELEAAPPGLKLAFAEALISGCPDASLVLVSAPGNAAVIVFTSGTTGKPKGVALSHAALHSQSMAKLLMCGYCSADVYLHAAPLFHIGGLSSALAMLAAGARHVFLPRFDGAALLVAIQQHAVTCFIAVPTMVSDLVAAASKVGVAALPSVARILVGGGGMSEALQEGLASLCPAATVHTAYGMTEAASSLTFATLWGPGGSPANGSAAQNASSQPPGGVLVGRPPPGIELAVYQPLGGSMGTAPLSSGGGCIRQEGEGEVVTRGPHVMLGYWDDEDATAAVQLPGGWLRTGDLGYLHQGALWLMGRAKDMIKTGGENVHAWEVERALASHPAVAVAAVVGASDWRLGEAVAAAVMLRPGWQWRGERCQVLLAGSPRQEAGKAALAAAAAAVAPAGPFRGGGLEGAILGGGAGENQEERQALGGGGIVSTVCVEDLRSTLLQRSPSRPGSGLGNYEVDGGMLVAAEPRVWHGGARGGQAVNALQLLVGVAAGLEQAAAAGGTAQGVDGSGSTYVGEEEQTVDGRILQQHCRSAGLAGFKLPRVFLLCDAAAGTSGVGAGRASSTVVMPVNSTGKVVKHLLRQMVHQHMQVAAKSGAAAGVAGRPRSRM